MFIMIYITSKRFKVYKSNQRSLGFGYEPN